MLLEKYARKRTAVHHRQNGYVPFCAELGGWYAMTYIREDMPSDKYRAVTQVWQLAGDDAQNT